MSRSARRVFQGLCGVLVFLLFMHHRIRLGDELWRRELYRFFDLNGEGNFPAWVSGSLLLLTSALAFFNYWMMKSGDKLGKDSRGWLFFAALFLFLSFDEISGFHESLTYITGIKWIYLYFPFFVMVMFFFLLAFRYAEPGHRNTLGMIFLGIFVFAAGGLFLEWIYYRFGATGVLDRFKFRLEEGLELFGVMLVFTGVFDFARKLMEEIKR